MKFKKVHPLEISSNNNFAQYLVRGRDGVMFVGCLQVDVFHTDRKEKVNCFVHPRLIGCYCVDNDDIAELYELQAVKEPSTSRHKTK